MFAKATALVAIVATLVSAHAAPDLQPGSLATRQDCTSTPGVTLRAGEWTKVEGLDNDQGGFGGPGGEWQLPLVQGSYGEERFTLITYQVGTGSWSDAVDAPQNLQEDKRFECTITAPNGLDSSVGCGVFTVTYTFPIIPTFLNGGIEAVCTRM